MSDKPKEVAPEAQPSKKNLCKCGNKSSMLTVVVNFEFEGFVYISCAKAPLLCNSRSIESDDWDAVVADWNERNPVE